MAFKERLTCPEKGNKYYTTKAAGGISTCVEGNTKVIPLPWKGSTLNNCVGAALGRFAEIAGKWYAISGNAEDIYANAQSKGLKVGQTPQVGALMVWAKGSLKNGGDGCGHIVCIERLIDENTVLVSQSGWSAKVPFWTAVHKKGTGNWVSGDDYSWMKSGYRFLGFIYNPAVKEEDAYTPKPLKISFNDTTLTVQAINKDDENYVRLRDLEEVVHLCAVGYYNNKVTINGKPCDLSKVATINKDGCNYVKLKDLHAKLKICTVSYNATKKLPVIKAK